MADDSSSRSGRNSVTGKPFTAFERAFLNARKAGDKTFDFRGKTYTTKLKSEHLLVPTPKPEQGDGRQGSPTRNQSPPGPQDRDLYGTMDLRNPPGRSDQPTPEDIAQEQAVRPPVPSGGALGLQGPGNPAGVPAQPPGLVQGPPANPPPAGLQGPGNPAEAPARPSGPHAGFDAELAAFQQRQAQAAGGPIGPPAPGQGQAAGGPIGGPGTAAGYVPPAPGQGQDVTMQLPPGPQPIGGDPGQGSAIDFQGLARYFYELGRQSLGGGKLDQLRRGTSGVDNSAIAGAR